MKINTILLLFIFVIIQGCSVRYYTLENKISTHRESVKNKESYKNKENLKFSIKVDGERYFRTRISKFSHKQLKKIREKYTNVTVELLTAKGYKPEEVAISKGNNLLIDISEVPHIGAVGVEYLTGLSFGLIPSWPTRKQQYIYKFTTIKNMKSHKYWVNDKRFNHLIAFPVFWIIFFVDNPIDKYKEALENFLEHNKI